MTKEDLQTETERLVLRLLREEDYPNWFEQYGNRLPAQYKYDDGRPKNLSAYTQELFINWISKFDESANEDKMYNLGVFRKEDGAFVGKIELYTILRMDYQWGMVGYSIHNQFWKNGYGLESVEAATNLFFEELDFHRIELHINEDNLPSVKLAKKAGFQFECIRERFSLENGEWIDYCIYYKNRM